MRVGVRQAGRQLSQLINRAVYGCERIVITSRGKPKAILLSVGEYERLGAKGGQRREVLIEARCLREAFAGRYGAIFTDLVQSAREEGERTAAVLSEESDRRTH